MSVELVYVTFPDRGTAKEVGASMVERELAACVTFWDAGTVYRWEGDVVRDEEALALFKTRPGLREELVDALEQAHPYDVPCVLPIRSEGGAGAYEAWVSSSTRASPSS